MPPRFPILPSASTHSALNRQWELLRQLPPQPPGISCADLVGRLAAAGYEVSKRTVERDLVDLSRQFPLQCNDKGQPYGWHWAPGAMAELPGISLSEALSLALVEQSLCSLLPSAMLKALAPRFSHARAKLENLARDNRIARWPDKVASISPTLNFISPAVDNDVVAVLHEALLKERQVRCSYYSAHNDKLRYLTLNPLAIVQRGQVSYLIGTAAPYSDVRQYALHRFREVEALATPAENLEQFSLDEYLATGALQFGSAQHMEHIALTAWVGDGLARLLAETPLSIDMRLVPLEEGYRLQATVADSWQLEWWVLSQGENFVVEAPDGFRSRIGQKLANASNRYKSDGMIAKTNQVPTTE